MALFFIKLVHSIVFVVESAAILYILYSAIFNVRDQILVVAVILVVAESVVYIGCGLRCPLTKVARRLGDATGDDFIADIFLPHWFALLIPRICGTMAAVGLLVIGIRMLTGI